MTDIPIINLALYAQTDVGMVRSGNEDNFLILDLSTGRSWTASEAECGDLLTFQQGYYGSLLAVSDGMGGALAGEVASRLAVETVRDRMLQLQAHSVYSKLPFYERLRVAIEEANLLINRESGANPEHKGLGATFTAVALHGDQVYFAQVGDSRAHLIRQGRIARITKDQSLVQQLIDAGQITEEEAETHSYRNVILQALGAHGSVNVEVSALRLRQLDTLLLCSDGLSGKMREDEIMSIVAEAPDLKTACRELVSLANERGGEDNITVVIAQFSGAGLAPPERQAIEVDSLAREPGTPTEISLDESGGTQPLAPPPEAPPGPVSDTPSLRTTTQIKPPPLPPAPSSDPEARPSRASPGGQTRAGDATGRRGPITSVFAAEDYQEDEQVGALPPSSSTATAATPRRTKTLTSDETEPGAAETDAGAGREEHDEPRPTKPGGGKNFLLLAIGGLALLGLFGGAFWYYQAERQAAEQRRLLAEREKKQQTLQARIGDLRERIAQLNGDLRERLAQLDKQASQTSNRMAAEEARRSLDALTQRLDEAQKNVLSPDKFSEVEQACNDIEESFRDLQSQVEKSSGLPPSQRANLRPVVC
jgi:serine/threonine protein phosphatase PrpC